jgi:uncharacterized membrane protein YebE (DUF533 family)
MIRLSGEGSGGVGPPYGLGTKETAMFNARDLLGQLMQAGMTGSSSNRIDHALGSQGLRQPGNPIGDLLRNFQGGGQSPGFGGLAEAAQSMFGDAKQSVQSGNPLAIGGLAALAGAVLGGGGAMRGALGGGALALLGSIAMSALRNYQVGAKPDAEAIAQDAPLGLREPQNPEEEAELERTADLILRAMISAAKADGVIDAGEMQRIGSRLEEAGADQEARDFVLAELQKPPDLEGLTRTAHSPEVAAQLYAASLLAIEVDTAAERDYLRRLANRLGLDAATVQRIHRLMDAPTAT